MQSESSSYLLNCCVFLSVAYASKKIENDKMILSTPYTEPVLAITRLNGGISSRFRNAQKTKHRTCIYFRKIQFGSYYHYIVVFGDNDIVPALHNEEK